MNSRAFFSIFVSAFAIIFLISLYYAQSVRFDTQSREAELSNLNQALSKDWFLARNALSNFASDAILYHIEKPPSGVVDFDSCNSLTQNDISNYDFGPDINSIWDDATARMKSFGAQCDVNLSGDIYRLLEPSSSTYNEVHSGGRAYGLLSCTRATSHASLTLTRPFVIRKEVRKDYPAAGECRLTIYDILGDNPTAGVVFEKIDVNKVYV